MVDTCVRRRFTDGAPDAYGNPVTTSTTIELPCRKVLQDGTERDGDQTIQVHQAEFHVPYDSDVQGHDVIEHDGDTWEVIGPPVQQSLPVRLRVQVRRTEAL